MSVIDKLITTIALAIITAAVVTIIWTAVRVTWGIIDWLSNKIDEWLDN